MKAIKVDAGAINNLIPNGNIRKVIYGVYALIGLVIGTAQVALSSLGMDGQLWLDAVLNVYAYLAVPVAGLAVVNSPSPRQTDDVEDTEYIPRHRAGD